MKLRNGKFYATCKQCGKTVDYSIHLTFVIYEGCCSGCNLDRLERKYGYSRIHYNKK